MLAPGQLATRSVPPSSLSLLGMVRHMADTERGWMWQHLVEEYARHNGQADLLREAIDGAAGL